MLASSAVFGTYGAGAPGTRFCQLSQSLGDTDQFAAGASLIRSPVSDPDSGVDGNNTQISLKGGRAIDLDKRPTAYAAS